VLTRWWIQLQDAPEKVSRAWLHGAVSTIFDDGSAHTAGEKPWRCSPLLELTSGGGRSPGFLVSTLRDEETQKLKTFVKSNAPIRLGSRLCHIAHAHLEKHQDWEELCEWQGRSRWDLQFITPVAISRGKRVWPWPDPDILLGGLAHTWRTWCGPRQPPPRGEVWVSDLDLRSASDTSYKGRRATGTVGTLTLRCDSPEIARAVDPLVRLSEFAGMGALRQQGFGVVRLLPAPGEL
jgi:CRISPR-associated endoribonuclease Cas6